MENNRLRAEQILENIKEEDSKKGKLRIFFGYAAGVGKTYAMLREAHEQKLMGKNVLIGYIEPHNRPETNELIEGLQSIPTKIIDYKGILLNELDVDKALELNVDIILVDELAHTNAHGSRNNKRYQDVEEILNAGIDVYTTMNVQHLESLNDIVEEITGVVVKETVPDIILDNASWKVIDIEPIELIERLEAGKIYSNENSKKALKNFFTIEKLNLLRGLAIQRTSEHINRAINSCNSQVSIQSKLLVIIEEDYAKMNERCIRWASRYANNIKTEWIAIMVRSDDDDKNIENEKVLSLAEKLGAETISLESENFIETIVEYAKLLNITDIVMGKNLQISSIKRIFHEDKEDILLKELPFVEIHLIPFKEEKKRKLNYGFKDFISSKGTDLFITVFAIIFMNIVAELFNKFYFTDQTIIMIYIFFIILVSLFTTGYLYSSISSLVAVMSYNWFFVEPLYSLEMHKKGYSATLIILLFISLTISNLVIRIKKKAKTSSEKEQQLEILYELNKMYLIAEKVGDIYIATTDYISKLLNREVILYDTLGNVMSFSTQNEESTHLKSKEESGIAFWVAKNQKEAGNGTETLSGAKGLYLPVMRNKETSLVLGIERNKNKLLNNNQLNYLRLVIAQFTIALEQMDLKIEKNKIVMDNERERIRSNLLRAISHDIRTPLTGISGIVETIINDEKTGSINDKIRIKLLKDVKEESEWLIRMVENLLSITRINSDTMDVNKTDEPVEEIVSSVIRRVKKVYPSIKINTEMPSHIIFIHVDPILIEQALFNLMDNAVRHGKTDKPVNIVVEDRRSEILFSVEDNGIGMSGDKLNNILDNIRTDKERVIDSKNGLGIGLTIVKTIINAHKGKFNVECEKGFTKFVFTIPKEV